MSRIVVGIDGSEHGDAALRFAVEEARRRDAELEVVLAWELPAIIGAPGVWVPIEGAESLMKEPRTELDGTIARVLGEKPDVDLVRSTPKNTPAAALLEAAKDADLLVVGSRGRGGFKGLLLGSVSQQCAQHAPCPVVIVPTQKKG
jgi:nucleotide-binding universal stress UspA family protein